MRTKHRRVRRKTRKGGSKYYYAYNEKPMLFTNVSNKQQGGDARSTLFPSFFTNIARDTGYQLHKAYNAGMGKYEPVNPSPLSQNLIRR